MLILLPVFLLASMASSLPIQEDCEKSKYDFLDCLKATYSGEKVSYPDIEATEAVFTQCGARKSECDFQKRLMEITEDTIATMKIIQEMPNNVELQKCSHIVMAFDQICQAKSLEITFLSLQTPSTIHQKVIYKCLVQHAFESCTEKGALTYKKYIEATTDGIQSMTILGGFLNYVTSMYKGDLELLNQ